MADEIVERQESQDEGVGWVPQIDKTVVKKALTELRSKILAFRAQANLPGPSLEGPCQGQQAAGDTPTPMDPHSPQESGKLKCVQGMNFYLLS